MKCPYCRTQQIRKDSKEDQCTYVTCKCPGHVIVEVWFPDDERNA